MNELKEYVIYIIIIRNKHYYIGCTENLKARKSKHKNAYKYIGKTTNDALYTALKNYKYTFKILKDKIISKEDAEYWEKYYIKIFKENNYCLYNKTLGGFHLNGKDNPAYKHYTHYKYFGVRHRDFKNACKRLGWNYDDFIPIMDLCRSMTTKDASTLYKFYHKDEILPNCKYPSGILTQSQVSRLKYKLGHKERIYEREHTTSRPHFKHICEYNNLNYSDFKLIIYRNKLRKQGEYNFCHKIRLKYLNGEFEVYDIDTNKQFSISGRVYLFDPHLSKESKATLFKDCYETRSINRLAFKKLCQKRNWNFNDFIEIQDKDKITKNGVKHYFYKRKFTNIDFDILKDRMRIIMYALRYAISRRSYALSDAKEILLVYGKDLQPYLLYSLLEDIQYEINRCGTENMLGCKTELILMQNIVKELLLEKGIKE